MVFVCLVGWWVGEREEMDEFVGVGKASCFMKLALSK